MKHLLMEDVLRDIYSAAILIAVIRLENRISALINKKIPQLRDFLFLNDFLFKVIANLRVPVKMITLK